MLKSVPLTPNLRFPVWRDVLGLVGSKRAAGGLEVSVVGPGAAGDAPCLLNLQMEREAEGRPLGVFKCQLCALTAPYSYVGQKPPDTQSVM